MAQRPVRGTRRKIAAVTALGIAVSSTALAVTAHSVAAGAAPRPLGAAGDTATFAAASSSIEVHGRGNGHGHGMSQYGAQGAAIAGLSSRAIVAFYYPGTTLTTLSPSTVRVSISAAGSYTTVSGTTPGLAVSGYGHLSTSTYQRYRLVPDGSGLDLGGQDDQGAWHKLRRGLPSRADFSSSVGYVRLFLTDGSSTRYRGTVGAVRSGSGLLTINRVSLDDYTMGVAPREMPASWRPAAVGAQAIAARTYARNAVESHTSSSYDICDTTWCQVYGGMTHYSAGGTLLWSDDPAAVSGNQNQVLRYGGHTIFAQFSASNGGAMLTGGEPYLVNKSDPYDDSASGDPYLDWSDSVSASSIASYYGLQSVNSIDVDQRNGYGPWGGWVLTATVNGTSWSGSTRHVSTTGSSLAAAMGVRTAYFHFDDEPTKPGRPTDVHADSGDVGAAISWSAPTDSGVTSYQLHWGHHTLVVPASQHRALVSPIWQTATENVWITARNSYGSGPAARVSVRGTPNPQRIAAISPYRLFDTHSSGPVSSTHPFTFDIAGKGTIHRYANSAQLSLTIADQTSYGNLNVYVHGAPGAPVASIPYHRGELLTTTVSIPLHPSRELIFRPTAGTVSLLGEQESYTADWGRYVRPVAPTWQRTIDSVSSSGSSAVSFAGAPVVNSDTTMVLIGVRAWSTKTGAFLRIWPDDRSRPNVVHAVARPYGPSANMLFLRLPASHVLRMTASQPGIGARVTLLGTVGNGGGAFEALPAQPIVDDSLPSRPGLMVGMDRTYLPVLGVGPTPQTGVHALLLQIRVTATRSGGKVWVWPTGMARPESSVIMTSQHRSQVTTALVMVGAGGKLDLQASTPGMKVSLFSTGYLTTPPS